MEKSTIVAIIATFIIIITIVLILNIFLFKITPNDIFDYIKNNKYGIIVVMFFLPLIPP